MSQKPYIKNQHQIKNMFLVGKFYTHTFVYILPTTVSFWVQKEHSIGLLTIFIHIGLKALSKSTSTALVPMSLVYWAATLQLATRFACVYSVSMDRPLEETRATYNKPHFKSEYLAFKVIEFSPTLLGGAQFQSCFLTFKNKIQQELKMVKIIKV